MAKLRALGHAVHPMLVVFPLGLLVTSLAWDICFLATRDPMWGVIAFWTIIAGIIGALLAAVPGFIDWLGIPDGTRAKRVGAIHMILNLTLVGLFIVSAALRYAGGYGRPSVGYMILGWIGIALGAVSGWLGGELVERLGVGVYADANYNAPSSLRSGYTAPEERRRTPPLGPPEPRPI